MTRSLNRPCSGSWRKKWGPLLVNCTLYSPLCPAHPGRICLVGMFCNYQMMESRYVRLFKTIVWLLYQSILTLSSYSLEGCAWSLFHSPWWPYHTPPCSIGHHGPWSVPSGYPNPTRYPVFLSIPDPTRFSFRNHRVAGNPKHRVLPDISGKPEVSGTTRYSGYHP